MCCQSIPLTGTSTPTSSFAPRNLKHTAPGLLSMANSGKEHCQASRSEPEETFSLMLGMPAEFVQTPWQDTNSSQFFICMKVPCCFCFDSRDEASAGWKALPGMKLAKGYMTHGMIPICSLVARPGLPSPGWQTLCFRPCDWWYGCRKVSWEMVGMVLELTWWPLKSGEACWELWARAWWNSNDWWLRRDLGLLMKFKLVLWIEWSHGSQ